MQFQFMDAVSNTDHEMDHVGSTALLGLGGGQCSNVVHDAVQIASARLNGSLNHGIDRVRAGEGVFPVRLDRFDLAQVNENTVGDSVGPRVAEDVFTEDGIIVIAHI